MTCEAFERGSHCDCSPCCRCVVDEQLKAIVVDEKTRQERHHDVLLLALKDFIDSQLVLNPKECVERARMFADLAYPPPKERP